MSRNFAGKVVLVTGASRGIRIIAEQFADNGASVVLNYANNASKAEEAVAQIKQKGGETIAIQADISHASK